MPFYYDATYVLVLLGVIIVFFASMNVKATFAKYSKQSIQRGYTASNVARKILDRNGLQQVAIEHVAGNLTDYFDPRNNTVYLSDATYNSNSVAAIGVAAHEVGHAIQHANGYAPIKLRNSFVPVANIGSTLSVPIVLVGFIMGLQQLVYLGIILFSAVLLFQLITLPVEFNASSRALLSLSDGFILTEEENKKAKKVLNAAAMTYVAAAGASALQLLRLIILANNNRRR